MTWDAAFSIVSTLALVCWAALILLPRRWAVLNRLVRLVVPLLLAIAYTALVMAFFFRAEGSFNSLADVRRLFQSDPMLLAGWIHYLAFDLLIGARIADRADARGVSRLLQAPILVATFLFGPLGWLLFEAVDLTRRPGALTPAIGEPA